MKEAGFKYLAFGVEAGNDKILKNINKGETIEVTEAAIKNALGLGFKVTLFLLSALRARPWMTGKIQ